MILGAASGFGLWPSAVSSAGISIKSFVIPSVRRGHRVLSVTSHTSVPVRTSVVVKAMMSFHVVAAMSSSVMPIDGGMGIVEMCVGIVSIDGEVPCTAQPAYRTVEIVQGAIGSPLPFIQDVADILVSVHEIHGIHIGGRSQLQEIVQIDFIDVIVLSTVQVQFIGHLIGKVISLTAGRLIIHGICPADCEAQ